MKAAIGAICIAIVTVLGTHLLQNGPLSQPAIGAPLVLGLLYDFQTLIGGGLAICAAWWTVATMNRTERAAADRHADQMDVAIRADVIAVERAVHPQLTGLRGRMRSLELLRNEMLHQNTFELQLTYIATHLPIVRSLFEDVVELLERPPLVDGSRLFEGLLAYKLYWVRERAKEADENVKILPFYTHRMPDLVLRTPEARSELEAIYRRIILLADAMPSMIDLLEETAASYGVAEPGVRILKKRTGHMSDLTR